MKPTEEFIIKQVEPYQSMLLYLISVIEKIVPEAELLLKYGIPYFYYKKRAFVYLAPNPKKGFLDVGFARGFQLQLFQEFLNAENRNTVKSLRYHSLEAIDYDVLTGVLTEAKKLYK